MEAHAITAQWVIKLDCCLVKKWEAESSLKRCADKMAQYKIPHQKMKSGQNVARQVNSWTKCHCRGQLLTHALSETHLLRLGAYFFFLSQPWMIVPGPIMCASLGTTCVIIALANAICPIFCVLSGTILDCYECACLNVWRRLLGECSPPEDI